MKRIKNFLAKAEKLAQSQVKQWENRGSVTTQIPMVSVLSYDEFEQQYGSNLYLDGKFDVLVFDGDLTLSQGTLNTRWLAKQFEQAGGDNDRQAMFVNGNLLIDGDIVDDDYLFLQVAKDVSCHYLHSENGNIVILGNLTALQGISGEYNDGMLQVRGKTQAPYIVSNDHSMPNSSTAEHIYIQDGQIGENYQDTLYGWDFFENSELMFKDGIFEDEHQTNISAFFGFVKNGENPLVDFETFQRNLADYYHGDEESDDDVMVNSQSIATLLDLEDFDGNDALFYQYIVDEYEAIEKTTDESEKYAFDGKCFKFSWVISKMVKNWRLIMERYSVEQTDTIRKICIKCGTDIAAYFLTIGDEKTLGFLYDFLNDELVEIEKDEPYLYETLVRVGLALHKFDEVYPLARAIDKNMPDVAKNIADVLDSEGYRAWSAQN